MSHVAVSARLVLAKQARARKAGPSLVDNMTVGRKPKKKTGTKKE